MTFVSVLYRLLRPQFLPTNFLNKQLTSMLVDQDNAEDSKTNKQTNKSLFTAIVIKISQSSSANRGRRVYKDVKYYIFTSN